MDEPITVLITIFLHFEIEINSIYILTPIKYDMLLNWYKNMTELQFTSSITVPKEHVKIEKIPDNLIISNFITNFKSLQGFTIYDDELNNILINDEDENIESDDELYLETENFSKLVKAYKKDDNEDEIKSIIKNSKFSDNDPIINKIKKSIK